MNHENTKSKKHEMFRKIFVFSFFRDFVMEVFLIRRWMFDVQFLDKQLWKTGCLKPNSDNF